MRFTLGQDPDTSEYVVGDTQTMTLILRGPASQFKSIQELVDAANGPIEKYSIRTDTVLREKSNGID